MAHTSVITDHDRHGDLRRSAGDNDRLCRSVIEYIASLTHALRGRHVRLSERHREIRGIILVNLWSAKRISARLSVMIMSSHGTHALSYLYMRKYCIIQLYNYVLCNKCILSLASHAISNCLPSFVLAELHCILLYKT